MRPLAPALLILLSGCAARSKTPPPPAPAQMAATPPGRYEVVATPPAAKPGPLMEAVLRRLGEQDAFAKLDSWTRLSTLPAWVSLESVKARECEFAPPGGAPGIMDAFSYTVIVGENRRPIVIRTGGFAGVYQIFEAKEPARRPEPASLPLSR